MKKARFYGLFKGVSGICGGRKWRVFAFYPRWLILYQPLLLFVALYLGKISLLIW